MHSLFVFGGAMVDNRESITAKLCAFARAYHSNFEPDKLFDDHLSFDLMGKEEYEETRAFILENYTKEMDLREFLYEYFAPIPLARERFTEEHLKRFATEPCQYVICGAGADTFSFRNDNEDIEVFEVDHPDTQRYKLERVRSLEWIIPKNVHFVPVDLNVETMILGLTEAGFDPGKKTFFTILGVSYYLTLPVFTETLRQIAELSANGSLLVFDFPLSGTGYPDRVQHLEQITADLGEKMTGGFSYNDVSRALYSLGFQIDTYLSADRVQKAYFDGRKDNMRAFENVSLLSATYTSGYVFE